MHKITNVRRAAFDPADSDVMSAAKDLLQLEGTNFDPVLTQCVVAAITQVENLTHRSVSGNDAGCHIEVYDSGAIALPYGPIEAITGVHELSNGEALPTVDYTLVSGLIIFGHVGRFAVDYRTTRTSDAAIISACAMQAAYLFTQRDTVQANEYDPKVMALINQLWNHDA